MKKSFLASYSLIPLLFLLLAEINMNKAQETTFGKVNKTLQVEIWSDVVCPFCYIGKRKLEKALENVGDAVDVQLIWKSFLLDPSVKSDTNKSIYRHLAESKGWSEEYARTVSQQVVQMAEKEGLHYNFDKVIVANSVKAHHLIQFSKIKGKGTEAEELLFEAYFSKGMNIDDAQNLEKIAQQLGFEKVEFQQWMNNDLKKANVLSDLKEAEDLGVNAVPFFLFNRKIAVSGAQDSLVFKNAIEKAIE